MTLSKFFSTVQEHAKWEHFLSRQKCSECLPSHFAYSVKLFLKLGTALLIGSAENCPISSLVRTFNSEPASGFGWRFKNSLVRRSPDVIFFHDIKFEELLSGHCSFSTDSSLEALLRDTCNARRTPSWSVRQQSIALFNELWQQKLVNSFNYCL